MTRASGVVLYLWKARPAFDFGTQLPCIVGPGKEGEYDILLMSPRKAVLSGVQEYKSMKEDTDGYFRQLDCSSFEVELDQ